MQKGCFLVFLASVCVACGIAQPKIVLVDSLHKCSIRGLCVVDNKVVWASGSNGQVARSVDGGKTFAWQTVAGYEKRDFRDIEAFDANTAIIMGIAEPAILLKTTDGGGSWKKVFEDTIKGMFLDAMDFADDRKGVVVGDPINGRFFFAETVDGGNHWTKTIKAKADSGEAFFASSGSNIQLVNRGKNYGEDWVYASGGLKSKLYNNRFPTGILLPILQGKESTGANSIAICGKKGVAVGGDFASDKRADSNCVLINLGKKISFSFPKTPPHGYRSSVVYIDKDTLVACGTSGVDISCNGGVDWQLISGDSFHVVQKAKDGKSVFLAGAKGRIGVLRL